MEHETFPREKNNCCIDVKQDFPHPFQGNLWKESLDILKLAVSHSSHLDTPPPRLSSCIVDNSWSADTAQMKKELPGRTLDFTFDLSATRVIGCPTALDVAGESGKESKTSSADVCGWRKPHLSQVC